MKQIWIIEGRVTDVAAHNNRAALGAPEWQFSDGPPDRRTESSDFLDLAEGLQHFAPAVFYFTPLESKPRFAVEGYRPDSSIGADGEIGPFMVYDSVKRDWLPFVNHADREQAQAACDWLNNAPAAALRTVGL